MSVDMLSPESGSPKFHSLESALEEISLKVTTAGAVKFFLSASNFATGLTTEVEGSIIIT